MHPPFGVLFSFLSRYYCAIGFRTYLELGVSASHLHARYPTRTTLELCLRRRLAVTGLSPSLVYHSRRLHLRLHCSCTIRTPHLPFGIQFALRCVQSPLLTASQLLSFPFPTMMFRFRKFLLLTEWMGCPIRGSPVLGLRAPRRSFSQLATPFVSVLNLAIH